MEEIDFIPRSRMLVKYEDLNPRGTFFGGRLMEFVDEQAAIFVFCQLETKNVVTKVISEINFVAPAFNGDVVEIGFDNVVLGRTSITFRGIIRNLV